MQGVGAPHCCEHSLPLERSSWEVEHSHTSLCVRIVDTTLRAV